LPSEYFREHIRVGSQPMLEPESNGQFWMMLDALHADETLVFSSDWPHFDWDDPATTFPKLPERLHRRVFAENARELFGLQPRTRAAAAASEVLGGGVPLAN
jgi:predicted TIM-barrel fold metal-dependent hydrolase